ncbi:MAG: FGGY-family carbohydrate kinase [Caldilineaceae bacterium]
MARADAARALLGGATTEGGNLFAWLRHADAARRRRAGGVPAHGTSGAPRFDRAALHCPGERARLARGRRATVSGIGLHTSAVDLVQAALEAIAYRFARIHQLIIGNNDPGEQTIVASGGALLRSPAWLQIFADVLSQPVVALRDAELTSRGLALLGLEALGDRNIVRPAADL